MKLRILIILLLIAYSTSVVFTKSIILRNVNLHAQAEAQHILDSDWENNGFEKVFKNLGETEANASVPTLMANKPAKLTTFLENFNIDFLFINFSFMIGKTMEPTAVAATAKETEVVHLPVQQSQSQSVSLTPSASTTSIATNTTTTSINSPAPAAIIQISFNPSDPNFKPEIRKLVRKKRELDSNDILQIRQMIDSAKINSKENSTLENKAVEAVNINPNSKPLDPKSTEENPNKEILELSNVYHNWKKSVSPTLTSKNIHPRPPGFYVLINDQIIFDNWVGVWNHIPNVIGKISSRPESKISNQTSILYTLENPGSSRKVKVNFEWEPPDSSTHLFLDDISISTRMGKGMGIENETPQETIINNTRKSSFQQNENGSGNQNITIYFIFKSDSNGVETKANFSHKENEIGIKLTTSSPRAEDFDGQLKKNETRSRSQPPPKELNHNNAFIVLAALGCSFFVILIFLLWIKMNGGKKCGRIPC